MIRRQFASLALALACAAATAGAAAAQNVYLSLNLEFNTVGNPSSGGTWTTVAKADPQGLAGVSMYLSSTNTLTAFLAPPEFEVRMQTMVGANRNVALGDNLHVPLPLGIGVIGSSFPSTYVDPPNLITYGSNPNFGSFTGGVALATGTFLPGAVPNWASSGANVTDANVFGGPSPPAIDANTFVTVRYVVPEPATLSLAGLAAFALLAVRTQRRR